MQARHHLYTFMPERGGEARRGGAQTVYLSPGLSADDRARLERHCLYERPDWLPPDAPLDKYPVARGYFLLDGARGALQRIVYRGKHGIRAGNFLAHHLIFPLAAFESGEPLAYLADDALFFSEFKEGLSPPEVPLPARRFADDPAAVLKAAFGDFAQKLLAGAMTSLEG